MTGVVVDGRVVVTSPYSGEVVDELPAATAADVDAALERAVAGTRWAAACPAHRRSSLLERAAEIVERDREQLARILTAEVGKPIGEARTEAARVAVVLRWCAAEALRRTGEVLPMDALEMGEGRLGFTLPEPCGVVAAITPFNYPAHLAAHKVGPALAAGNAVVLKPAEATPLSGLFLQRAFHEAGVPEEAFGCLVGDGRTLGEPLCADPRVRKISFTGSVAVGKAIARVAGLKRLTCELGANCAVVVLDDGDLEAAASAVVHSGFVNAGQVCTSTQRVLVPAALRDELAERIAAKVDELRPGDPFDEATTLGPVIEEAAAERVAAWVAEAVAAGGVALRGGGRDGAMVEPAVVVEPPADARMWRDELFGPAVGIRAFGGDEEALAAVNDTRYGLSVGLFTGGVDRAIRFARELRTGCVHVNNGPLWRTAFMPYGGVGDSGFGKEGVKYAMEEMTERKLVVVHPGARA